MERTWEKGRVTIQRERSIEDSDKEKKDKKGKMIEQN